MSVNDVRQELIGSPNSTHARRTSSFLFHSGTIAAFLRGYGEEQPTGEHMMKGAMVVHINGSSVSEVCSFVMSIV